MLVRLSGFVCCRYLDSCLRRCSQLFCSTDFALPNTNTKIDCETNWNKNHERNTVINYEKYKMFDSCLRWCSQLFCSTEIALPNTNIDCETNWNTHHERNTDKNLTNTKCLTAVCADARSVFDPQTLHRQLLHVILCRSNFLLFFFTKNIDSSSTLHTSQIMTQR